MQNRKKNQIILKIIWNASDSPICTSAKLAIKKKSKHKVVGRKTLF